jgi:hypothetical protein
LGIVSVNLYRCWIGGAGLVLGYRRQCSAEFGSCEFGYTSVRSVEGIIWVKWLRGPIRYVDVFGISWRYWLSSKPWSKKTSKAYSFYDVLVLLPTDDDSK